MDVTSNQCLDFSAGCLMLLVNRLFWRSGININYEVFHWVCYDDEEEAEDDK